MKKLKTAFIALLVMGLGTMVNAQDKTTTPAPAPAKQTDKKPAASGQHLKKDGTPDKRYKENKEAPATEKKATSAEKKTDAKPATSAKSSSKKSSTKAKADKTTK